MIDEVFAYIEVMFMIKMEREMPIDLFNRGYPWGFTRIEEFCDLYETTEEDILIILGDAGINFYLNERDIKLKEELYQLPLTLFCIHGNHEERPDLVRTYEEKNGRKAWFIMKKIIRIFSLPWMEKLMIFKVKKP